MKVAQFGPRLPAWFHSVPEIFKAQKNKRIASKALCGSLTAATKKVIHTQVFVELVLSI